MLWCCGLADRETWIVERQREAARGSERQREAERGRERQREAEGARAQRRHEEAEGELYLWICGFVDLWICGFVVFCFVGRVWIVDCVVKQREVQRGTER